ncbi:PAS domain S-box protein [Halobellus marinus]|uniref:PAS domain S-box protein n=1 Tax=Halobellus TaxID=1073986 RepID=UPI0028A709F4|nr:PAS domain S-box protein [Halobellus sp. DFY28]
MTGGIRVLCVADGAAESTAHHLGDAAPDFEIVTETRTDGVLDRLANDDERIDCVVSEQQVGDGNGIELLGAVRGTYPDLPVLLVAEPDADITPEEAIAAGATDFLRRRDGVDQGALFARRIETAVEASRAVGNGGDQLRNRETANVAQLRLFREAVEASGHAVYFTERDGTIIYVNEAFEATTGYSAEEAIGRTPRILKSGEHDREFYERLWGTILAGDVWRSEITNRTKSGDRYVVDQTIAPVETDAGATHFVAVNAEITGHKERQAALERNRKRLNALFENSPDAITVHDVDGEILRVNRQQIENLGYSREELLSMNVADVEARHSRETLRETWTKASVGERVQIEGRHRRKDGSTFPVEVWITKAEIDATERFIAFSRDITDRKADERELERQIDRLEQFATVVSHDLRNPLNVAKGRLDLVETDPDHRSEHRKAAQDALGRMEELIEDLLVLAREGGNTGETEPVDLGELLSDCQETVSAPEASFVVDTDRQIRADRSRLQQLFENLVRNAIEHGRPDVTVTVGDLADGFYVADDGPGIPAEEREQVFETGFTTTEDGTGLGLNIVKQIADAHGWDVAVTESDDGGARFEFTGVDVVE